MKLSLNWINEYTKIDETPSVLAEKISASLAEVEAIHEINDVFDGIVIGEIVTLEKHPNADSLQIAKVNVGKEKLTIVCGANNISVGDLVPVILVGNTLPGSDMVIDAREVRGQVSHGMLCSPKELGISNDHSGILLLNHEKDAKVGKRFDSLFETQDTIIEIENKALTHRPDTFSHLGIARELSVMFSTKFTLKENNEIPLEENKEITLSVALQNEQLCRRFSGVIVPDIIIRQSPLWMQARLHRIGVRTTNNIVDITNYVMHAIGQPMHAFDRRSLTSDRIIVRTALPEEQITTLDGVTRELTQDMLVIADEARPIALAGVMGGASTEISDSTTDIIIESANFEHYNNRKTSRLLGLQSEASTRFSKNQDPSNTLPALAMAVALLKQHANASVRSEVVDITHEHTFDGRAKKIIPYTTEYLNNRVGGTTKISDSEISRIFSALGIEKIEHGKHLGAVPPTYRPDLILPADLVEEVARMIGYDAITPTLPTRDLTPAKANQRVLWQRRIKATLAQVGLTEVYNYSFVGRKLYEQSGLENDLEIKLSNPIAPEVEYLKPYLLPQLINNITENTRYTNTISLFEIDRVHQKNGVDIPGEENHLAIGMYNKDYLGVKGVIEILLQKLSIPNIRYEVSSGSNHLESLFSPTRVAHIFSNDTKLGIIGELTPSVQATFGLDRVVGIAELNAESLLTLTDTNDSYTPVSQHPAISIDLSLIVPDQLSLHAITQKIHQTPEPLLVRTEIIDSVKDENRFGSDKKAVTLRLVFQSVESSLRKDEIQSIVDRIKQLLQSSFDLSIK